jgi:hypothetical protein
MENKEPTWLAKHRVFTRFLTVTLGIAYLYSIYRDKVNEDVVSTTGWLVFLALMVLTFGLNSIDKIVELIKAWKGK